jgi:phenylacetate-CoA ligase
VNHLYYDASLETTDRASLRLHHEKRLRELADALGDNHFYMEKLSAAGIRLDQVSTLDSLAHVPFTTKADLLAEQAAHPPFGRLLTYPVSRYRHLHQTSGTTGRPLRWLDTAESWEWWARCWGYVYRGAGITEDDLVFCAFSFGPYISHWTAIHGAWHVGAMCLSGGGMNSEQRLQAIIDNRCTVLVCTPTYALRLAEVARERGIDLASSAIRRTIHAGEPGASLPNVKRTIEQAWGATCFDHAGATEAGAWAFDCEAQSGAIHLNEAEFIFEVIDPETGRPINEGEQGELVVTNLGRVGMPVLRYRSGDLVKPTSVPCSCGRTFSRIEGGVLGRADDMIIVRGVNLYPSAIDNLIRSVRDIVEYEVNIRRIMGMDDLLIRLETSGSRSFEAVSGDVRLVFRNHFNIRVSIEQAADGSLPRYEFKARRFRRTCER